LLPSELRNNCERIETPIAPVCPTDCPWCLADQSDGAGWQAFYERKTVVFDAQSLSLGEQEVAGLTFDCEPHHPFGAFEMDPASASKSQGPILGKLDDLVPQ